MVTTAGDYRCGRGRGRDRDHGLGSWRDLVADRQTRTRSILPPWKPEKTLERESDQSVTADPLVDPAKMLLYQVDGMALGRDPVPIQYTGHGHRVRKMYSNQSSSP